MPRPIFDEIGYWSEIKHEIIKEYASAYTRILERDGRFGYGYIDAFSGMGEHRSKQTGEIVKGSPLNALEIEPRFHEFHFIDLDEDKIGYLRDQVGDEKDVNLYEGDCNEILLEAVFPRFRYRDYRRALCLLDPYGLTLDWQVIDQAGREKSIEIFLNFPVMDMNRNALWREPEKVSNEHVLRMTRFWGDETWRDAAYTTETSLFGYREKESNEHIAEAFRQRLVQVAKFRFVPQPLPMRNSKGAVVYYLFFASYNQTGGKIVGQIFSKYRNRSEI